MRLRPGVRELRVRGTSRRAWPEGEPFARLKVREAASCQWFSMLRRDSAKSAFAWSGSSHWFLAQSWGPRRGCLVADWTLDGPAGDL